MSHTKKLDDLVGKRVNVLFFNGRISGTLAKDDVLGNYVVSVRNAKGGNDAFIAFWVRDVTCVNVRNITIGS